MHILQACKNETTGYRFLSEFPADEIVLFLVDQHANGLEKDKSCQDDSCLLSCYVHCQMIHNYEIYSHRCVQHIVHEHVVFLYKF